MKERGAILIHVAIALLALLAFSAVIVDYGVMWVSRRQAQNAADAAAMAGARSLPIDGGQNAEAVSAALAFAGLTSIWGQPTAPADVVVSSLPFACPAGTNGGGSCIRVDVMRGTTDRSGTAHSNTLPVFFGGLIGVTPQGVRATATAQAAPGNAVQCIKPWMVADRWLEGDTAPWNQNTATFNPSGPPPIDVYVPPSSPGTTGFTVADNYGLQLILKSGIGPLSAGWTEEIDLGTPTTAGQISGCPSFVPTVGIYNPSVGACAGNGDATDPARGCVSVRTTGLSPVTTEGVGDLVARDPGATWDAGTKTVIGSDSGMSPRIVPLAVFDTQAYYNETLTCTSPGCVARVVNIIGFFVEGMCNTLTPDPGVICPDPNSDVVGRLMNYPAQVLSVAGSVTAPASFLTVTRLVR